MPTQTFFNLPKDKQDKIMDAVLDELSIHDYESFNISNIIRQTQMARGSFYQYFLDKDDLYTYFYTYIGELKFKFYGPLFDPHTDISLMDRLYEIFEKGLVFRVQYPKLVAVSRKMMLSNKYLDDPSYQKGYDMAIDLYAAFIENDIKNKIIRPDIDVRLFAEMIMVLFNHLTINSIIKKTLDDQTIKHMLTHILSILNKGVSNHV
jgi:AcrR family transcriptional regulator